MGNSVQPTTFGLELNTLFNEYNLVPMLFSYYHEIINTGTGDSNNNKYQPNIFNNKLDSITIGSNLDIKHLKFTCIGCGEINNNNFIDLFGTTDSTHGLIYKMDLYGFNYQHCCLKLIASNKIYLNTTLGFFSFALRALHLSSKYLVVLFQHQHHSKSKIAVFDYDLNLVNVKHFDIYENFITIANKLSIDPHCIY